MTPSVAEGLSHFWARVPDLPLTTRGCVSVAIRRLAVASLRKRGHLLCRVFRRPRMVPLGVSVWSDCKPRIETPSTAEWMSPVPFGRFGVPVRLIVRTLGDK